MNKNNKQSGAAAMITVVFVAIILSIMTLSFIRLALNESQISSDDDLTTRAYYAAESGVEEAKRAINDFFDGDLADLRGDECALPDGFLGRLSLESDYDMEYICQFIDLNPAVYQYHFDAPNQTVQVPIRSVDAAGAAANFNRMVVRWHVNDSTASGGDGPVAAGQTVARTPATDVRLFDTTAWNSQGYPAMLRLNLISHPTPITASRINNYIAYLNPVSGVGTTAITFGNNARILPANCNPAVIQTEMFCEMEITGLNDAARDYTLRLTNLYESAHVEIFLYNNLTQRYFEDAQAVIDVTGRAGSVFRRVESVVELSTQSIFPNESVTSLSRICKDFIFTDDAGDFDGVTPDSSCTE